jgi:hypothetical protein
MSFRDKTSPHSSTNEFDLAKEAFRLLTSKMADYERLVEIQQEVSDRIYNVLREVQAVSPHVLDLKREFAELRGQQAIIQAQLDSVKTQQAVIILEAKLIHRDLDILLDLFGDVATYAKDDEPKTKRMVYGDAG